MSDAEPVKKPQPYQRQEDQGPTQLYVDAKPWETAPKSESDREREHASKEMIKENTTGSEPKS